MAVQSADSASSANSARSPHVAINIPDDGPSTSGSRPPRPNQPTRFGFSYKKIFLGLAGLAAAGAGLQGLLGRRADQGGATGGLQPYGQEPDGNSGAVGGHVQGVNEPYNAFMERVFSPPPSAYTEADIPDYVGQIEQEAFEGFLSRMPTLVECPALCNILGEDGVIHRHHPLGVLFLEPQDVTVDVWGDFDPNADLAGGHTDSHVQGRQVELTEGGRYVQARGESPVVHTREDLTGPEGADRYRALLTETMQALANFETGGGFTGASTPGRFHMGVVHELFRRRDALQEITNAVSNADPDNDAGMQDFVRDLNQELRALLNEEIDRLAPGARSTP